MPNRLLAAAVAAVSISSALAVVAPAASAQSTNPAGKPTCSAYPARDGAYGMRVSPAKATVNRNSRVVTAARVFRNGKPCPNRGVDFSKRGPGKMQGAGRNRKMVNPPFESFAFDTTDARGLATAAMTVTQDTRFQATFFDNSGRKVVREGLIQVRKPAARRR